MPSDLLTVVVPTRNRPRHCLALLRYFGACGVRYPILVADSSIGEAAEAIRRQCGGGADYKFYDPNLDVARKYLQAAKAVKTPYMVMLPDDDIAFPHAIDAALDYLKAHPDYVAAQGYTLSFGLDENDVDVHSVFSFVPTIGATSPLYRHYDLMRRYQPFMWAVFRTEAFAVAMAGAAAVHDVVFKELTFMSRAVLAGKVARLPIVYAMRGMEESLSPAKELDPRMWFLDDPEAFFRAYLAYRNSLAAFIRAEQRFLAELPADSPLEHVLDLNHAAYLGREVDTGMINHKAQLLLGVPLPPISLPRQWAGGRAPEPQDRVDTSRLGNRRYIWRRSVLEAEPRDEITIRPEEIAAVEEEFDAYRLE